MFYSDDIIEEVRSRNDIVDVVGSYVHLKRNGSGHVGLCPFHNEKTPSFHVNAQRQTYKCFGCGKGGNVFTFLMEYENFSFPESVQYLAERAGVTLPQINYTAEMKQKADFRTALLDVYKKAAVYYYNVLRSPRGKDAMAYITGRKLTEKTCRDFGIGYSDGSLYEYLKQQEYSDEFLKQTGIFAFTEKQGGFDKFWRRVMFPILDRNGKVIAFGGRIMGDGEPKYLNSQETAIFEKGRNLYGLHLARRSKRSYFLLCEGYMDVISLHQAGFDNAVASLGTALTSEQANLIARYTKEAVITYDSDGAGQKAALRAIPILKQAGIYAKVLDMRPYKDPDEFIKALGAEEYEKRIASATSGFFFQMKVLAAQFDDREPEQVTKFYQEAAKRMLEFPNALERKNYVDAFCREYQAPYEEFNKFVNELGARQTFETPNEPREGENQSVQKKKAENGVVIAEKLLLTWCAAEPDRIKSLSGILEAADFEEGIMRQVAEMSFEDYRQTGRISTASLISRFESKEEQSQVADIFSTQLPKEVEAEEMRKAFADTVIKIKQKSLEAQKLKALLENDSAALAKSMRAKNELKALHKTLMSRA